MVRGHSLAHDTRWAGVGTTPMSSPGSARSTWAALTPMPGTASSRATAGRTAASGPVPASGPVVPSVSTPCAAGMAASSSWIRAVRRSIWAVRASYWSSSRRASSAWWSSNRPVRACTSAACLAFIRPRARPASTLGSRWPEISASSIARPDLPMMSVATVDSLIRAFQQLLEPLDVPGPVPGQVDPQPGVVAQLADLGWGNKAGPQHAPLGQLGQPDRIELVGLGPARDVLDLPSVDQLHAQAPRLQQVQEGAAHCCAAAPSEPGVRRLTHRVQASPEGVQVRDAGVLLACCRCRLGGGVGSGCG